MLKTFLKRRRHNGNYYFYGAGSNVHRKYEKWVKEGLKLVCFVDQSIEKQHTYFDAEREIEILSL